MFSTRVLTTLTSAVVAAAQFGPQSGDTFTVEGTSNGPIRNISYPISPILPDSTVFNLSNAYERSQEGLLATVPLGGDFYEVLVSGIEDFSPDMSDIIDESASSTFSSTGTTVPVNCTDACGFVEWHPHFRMWFGTFEPSDTYGSLAVPVEGGDILVNCVECDARLPPTFRSDAQAVWSLNWRTAMPVAFAAAVLGL